MKDYVVLLRGINVGGKNKIRMADLKICLEENQFKNVQTYIQSGNILVQSELNSMEISSKIEKLLIENFVLDSTIIRVLTIDAANFNHIYLSAPDEFGSDNDFYRYDVIFLIDVSSEQAMNEVETRDGIDLCWQSNHALFYRRPGPKSPDYTRSALSKVIKKKIYQSLTIRNWNTVSKLATLLEKRKEETL